MKLTAEERRSRGEEVRSSGRIKVNNDQTPQLPASSAPRLPSAPLPLSASANAVMIAGIPVDNLSQDEAVDAIDTLISEGGSHYGAVVNAAKLVAANRDENLKRALLGADLVTADGMSVVWASRLLGRGLKERVTGVDVFERLVERAARRGFPVYFLGAGEESVRGTVEVFAKRHPALRIAGYRNGYFEVSDSKSVCEAIRRSGAVLLFVAMGSPRQENWIASHLALTGVRFALGVGGSFDHLSGRARRAPRWIQRSGLEWLHRLLQEPRRLWRGYLIGNSVFIWLVISQRLRGRGPASKAESH